MKLPLKGMLILVIVSMFVLSACSSGPKAPGQPRAVFQPEWYNQQGDPEYVFTYGQSEKVSQNASEQAAYANAMQEAAQFVEAHVQSMIKNYIEEAGVEDPQVLALTSSVARVIANARFSGTQISRRESFVMENGRYKTFVRVSIPKNEINNNLHNQIKNEEALYNQFKASQAFQELDRVIEQQ
jgi:hypothetical protein